MTGRRLRDAVRDWLPPALLRLLRSAAPRGIRFEGDYASWQAALARSSGYDAEVIIERVTSALHRVKSGEAVAERDSVLLDRVDLPFPLLAGILLAAAASDGRLTVVDFGGSLGSTYFLCRNFLSGMPRLAWCVVEQESFVRRGREAFETEQLRFFRSIDECQREFRPDVVLFSGVLQYLPEPLDTLGAAAATGARCVVVDRTPFSALSGDRLCVQHVPERIYPGSYPCWIFGDRSVRERLAGRYDLVAEFDAADGGGRAGALPFAFKGMIWQRCRDV